MIPSYRTFSAAVAGESAARWNDALTDLVAKEEQLWRLLRFASAPYFLLGSSSTQSLRLRVATPWDWRQRFRLLDLAIVADATAGQPLVRWTATILDLEIDGEVLIEGVVEIRWSHGKFSGVPEAKIQLGSRHEDVPGYFPLT